MTKLTICVRFFVFTISALCCFLCCCRYIRYDKQRQYTTESDHNWAENRKDPRSILKTLKIRRYVFKNLLVDVHKCLVQKWTHQWCHIHDDWLMFIVGCSPDKTNLNKIRSNFNISSAIIFFVCFVFINYYLFKFYSNYIYTMSIFFIIYFVVGRSITFYLF